MAGRSDCFWRHCPPVMLGVIILVSFLVALAPRVPLERRFVLAAPEISQPKRSFMLELGYSLCAGVIGNKFAELNGKGMVLGVDDAYRYDEFSRQGWNTGDIILIGTDGIHETRNEDDQMFGQQRVQEIIRKHAAAAKDINRRIIDTVQKFRGKAPQQDDVTLVVIKLQ